MAPPSGLFYTPRQLCIYFLARPISKDSAEDTLGFLEVTLGGTKGERVSAIPGQDDSHFAVAGHCRPQGDLEGFALAPRPGSSTSSTAPAW